MKAFEINAIDQQRHETNRAYLEFLRETTLSAGLYVLPEGGIDGQKPHTEDEVYYVVSGKGRFISGGEEIAVGPGSVMFVAAGQEHRFHSITEELKILVFFAPAEYTHSGEPL